MSGDGSRRSKEFGLDAPEFRQFGGRRLRLAAFIRAARLEHGFLSVPIPGEPKPRVRLRIDRTLDFGFLPSLTPVNGYFNFADHTSAGPSQAANLIESWADQFLPTGRTRDHRPRPHFELEPA